MYISKIQLRNIKCFEDITLNLDVSNDARKWAIVLGENGVGKTTLLRSIAVGLCDRTGAAGLISDLQGEWVRQGSPDNIGSIEIELIDTPAGKKVTTKIEIKNENGRETIQEFQNPMGDSPHEDIFVCAYGAGRDVQGTRDYSKYRIIDSVYSLFDYETNLQNPELIFRRIESGGVDIEQILESIDQILMLEPHSTQLDSSGISISGPWGEFMPLGSVGDGYKSTLTWVADFLGWAMFYQGKILKRETLGGIVLVDEVEQHLHPVWQRQIIHLLHSQFPNTQFIGTSHSPLCASGLADIPDEKSRLILLERTGKEGAVEAEAIPSLRGYRADQVLTSRAFGLSETRNSVIERTLEKFRELLLKEALSETQKAEIEELRNLLQMELPSLAEREEDRALERRLREQIGKSLAKDG